jgi:ABC-type transporter Mla MlaB component
MRREPRTLRIDFEESAPDRTTLRLAGRLGAEEIASLLQSVNPLLDSGCVVTLDLAALRFVDSAAHVLVDLKRRRAAFAGARGYVAEILRVMEDES